jgi:hypothetical protein
MEEAADIAEARVLHATAFNDEEAHAVAREAARLRRTIGGELPGELEARTGQGVHAPTSTLERRSDAR